MDKVKLFDSFAKICVTPLNVMIKHMSPEHQKKAHLLIMKRIYSNENYAILSYLPRRFKQIENSKGTDQDFSRVAIVLQGPLNKRDNFTLETVKMYRHFYNNVIIVVSTWASEDQDYIKAIREAGADVVQSERPKVSGIGNINFQLASSLAGCKYAMSLGAKFCWKTRTDQRYYNPCALPLLAGMLHGNKLVLLGGVSDTYYKRYFQISDFMSYGRIEDLMLLYSCPLDEEDISETHYSHKKQGENSAHFDTYINEMRKSEADCTYVLDEVYDSSSIEYANPETIIAYNYYKMITVDCDDESVSGKYKKMLDTQISIVDADSLGFFWIKYEFSTLKESYFDRYARLDFAKWITIKNVSGKAKFSPKGPE